MKNIIFGVITNKIVYILFIMSLNKLWEEFYNILKYDRIKLPLFLEKYGNHDTLQSLLEEIEKNMKDDESIKQLFLGKLGYEFNKQRCIYELPTKELVSSIISICDILGINKIEELGAGQGLLGKMLDLHNNKLDIKVTDGERWLETSGEPYFKERRKKTILEYVLDNNSYDDTLLVAGWIDENSICNDFNKFISIKKPNQFMIIGDDNNYYNMIKDNANGLGYKMIVLKIKQLSFKDSFLNKAYRDYSKSKTLLFLKNDIISESEIKEKIGENNFSKASDIRKNDKIIIQDCINNKKLPDWVINYLEKKELEEIIIILSKAIRYNIKVPKFIDTYDDLILWHQLSITKKFPRITHKDKYEEFKLFYNRLNSENGLNKLKEDGVIPRWILNIEEAELFLYLDYSTDNKTWKYSRNEFMRQFSY